ncbi:MAG: fibronectin type III domain-containing protein [Bacteroidetes bacterium]|nr:fibronectin type III domain-containing protein [Bacteroidota bacterium]
MKPIIAVFSLSDITDTGLVGYSQEKIEKLKDNPHYPDPLPEKDAMAKDLGEYIHALGDSDDGRTADTEIKNERRAILENALMSLGLRCAQIAEGNLGVFLTSGFEVRKPKESKGILPQPENVVAKEGTHPGTLLVIWDPVQGARCYAVEVTDNPTSEQSWSPVRVVNGGVSTRSETRIIGLASMKRYWIRVAGVNFAGAGAFSEHAVHVTQ